MVNLSISRVIVIGGGASGLVAAGVAAQNGADVVIVEKMKRCARKLRITGKGRCNLTNVADIPTHIGHFGKNGRFLYKAYSRFFVSELIDLMGEIGVKTVTERGGRVFPVSEKAQDVVDALVKWCRKSGVEIHGNSTVEKIIVDKKKVTGVRVSSGRIFEGDSVVLATGGMSYPLTGSTGDGYKLAESVGHTITRILPSQVPLETSGDVASRLEGLSLRNVKISVYSDGKKKDDEFGEMCFTDTGVTGPIVLKLSRLVVQLLSDEKKVELSFDLKPALDMKKLDARILRDLKGSPKQHFKTLLKNFLPPKLIPVCVEGTGIDEDKVSHQITVEERKRFRMWLKDFRLVVVGHRGFEEAIVTSGGVSLKEVDAGSMESRIIKGLFIVGELLDLDANTGGYNLQAAFSSGWVAGVSLRRTPPPFGKAQGRQPFP